VGYMAYIDIPNDVIEEKIEKEVRKQLENNGLLRFIRRLVSDEVDKKINKPGQTLNKLSGDISGIKKKIRKLQNL
jgi:hypothetical protein